MSALRHVANICIGAAGIIGLGASFDLEEVRSFASSVAGIETSAPNLGDCLHNVDRSYWPRTYAAICKDIRAGIAAELESTPVVAPPITRSVTAAPVPPQRPPHAAKPTPTPPVPRVPPVATKEEPSCVVTETGTVVTRSGDKTDRRPAHFSGTSATARGSGGLALDVPSMCTLQSPVNGRVLFAGEFKGYRGVLIVGLSGGHRLVIAGLGTLTVKRGETIARGQTLATTATEAAPALATSFGDGAASLIYFDMRNREGLAEPLPWLSAAS